MSSIHTSQRGSAIVTLLVLIVIAVITVAFVFGKVVPPGFMGIRQVLVGPAQGYSDTGLQPGYHWRLPFYSTLHVLPSALQVLQFGKRSEDGELSAFAPLEVQTIDGATVDVDISVLYRLASEAGEITTLDPKAEKIALGGPRELITKIGLTEDAWKSRIKTIADDELKRALGKLNTAQFYDPKARGPLVEAAAIALQKRAAPFGVQIEAMLLRRTAYRSQRIDDAIFQKNLQEIEERLNSAASKLAEARAQLENVAARLDAEIETSRVEGERNALVVRSEGDRIETEKTALGELEIAKARAQADKLKAEAFSNVAASERAVARELLPLLQSLQGGVVSGLDPYKLDEWLKRFGIKDLGARPQEGQ